MQHRMIQKIKEFLKKLAVPLMVILIVFGVSAIVTTRTAEAGCLPFFGDGFSLGSCIAGVGISAVSGAMDAIGVAVFALVGWILVAAGFVLKFSVDLSVVHMAEHVKGLAAVKLGWVAFRDLANMAFIFVLLFSAISTILRIDTYGAKRILPKLVIVALLLNFSFYFTGIIIDASNVVAVGFTDNINCTTGTGAAAVTNKCSMAEGIMQALNLQSVANPDSMKKGGLSEPFLIFIFTILGSAFMFITACIFFTVAVLLVTRFVVLIFILILSPLAFVSMIIPGASITKKWQKTLISQALFAPLFFVLMWFVLTVISDNKFKDVLGGDRGSFTDAFNAQNLTVAGTSMRIVLNFIIVTVFEIAALVIAKSMASEGGPAVSKMVGFATKAARGAVLGGAAYAGRNTIGRLANSQTVRNVASRSDLMTAGLNKVAAANFGAGGKGGFVGQLKRKGEREIVGAKARTEREKYLNEQEGRRAKREDREAQPIGHTDEKAVLAAKTERDRITDEQNKNKTPAQIQKANADRTQNEKDIQTKNKEEIVARGDLNEAIRRETNALTQGAKDEAARMKLEAQQKLNRINIDRQNLIGKRDAIQKANINVEEAQKKKISVREYEARKQESRADRFGGKNNIIGTMYTNLLSQGAAERAKALRREDEKYFTEKEREQNKQNKELLKTYKEKKEPLAQEQEVVRRELTGLKTVEQKYGAGADLTAQQNTLLTRQQDLQKQIKEAGLRNGLAKDRHQKLLAGVEKDLSELSAHLTRFGATADIAQEISRREVRDGQLETEIKKIDQDVAKVGEVKEETIMDAFREFRNEQKAGGGDTKTT